MSFSSDDAAFEKQLASKNGKKISKNGNAANLTKFKKRVIIKMRKKNRKIKENLLFYFIFFYFSFYFIEVKIMDPRKRMLLNKKNERAKIVLKQLKTLMETYNISHQEVAEALGVGRTAVTKWLVGERFPLEETLNKIEDYIDNYHISTPGYDLLGDLQTYMIENDVTLQEVAEQIGVTHPTIIRWLRESVYPTPKNIKKIKDFLDRQ